MRNAKCEKLRTPLHLYSIPLRAQEDFDVSNLQLVAARNGSAQTSHFALRTSHFFVLLIAA